jgi:hypothetical protein
MSRILSRALPVSRLHSTHLSGGSSLRADGSRLELTMKPAAKHLACDMSRQIRTRWRNPNMRNHLLLLGSGLLAGNKGLHGQHPPAISVDRQMNTCELRDLAG